MARRKSLALLLALALTLCALPALAQTVSPMPATVDPAFLAHREVLANITDYDTSRGDMQVTLLEPVMYSAESIRALAVGDVIVMDGYEYTVENLSFDQDGAFCYINEYEDGAPCDLMLYMENPAAGTYRPLLEGDERIVQPVGTLTLHLPDSIVLLDYIDPETGEPLDMPAMNDVYWLVSKLLAAQRGEDAVGFAACNTYILFDEYEQPCVVRRIYVPWQ